MKISLSLSLNCAPSIFAPCLQVSSAGKLILPRKLGREEDLSSLFGRPPFHFPSGDPAIPQGVPFSREAIGSLRPSGRRLGQSLLSRCASRFDDFPGKWSPAWTAHVSRLTVSVAGKRATVPLKLDSSVVDENVLLRHSSICVRCKRGSFCFHNFENIRGFSFFLFGFGLSRKCWLYSLILWG